MTRMQQQYYKSLGIRLFLLKTKGLVTSDNCGMKHGIDVSVMRAMMDFA